MLIAVSLKGKNTAGRRCKASRDALPLISWPSSSEQFAFLVEGHIVSMCRVKDNFGVVGQFPFTPPKKQNEKSFHPD